MEHQTKKGNNTVAKKRLAPPQEDVSSGEEESTRKKAKDASDKLWMSCKQWSWNPSGLLIIQMCSPCHSAFRELKGTPNILARLCSDCVAWNYKMRFPNSPDLKPFVPLVETDDE